MADENIASLTQIYTYMCVATTSDNCATSASQAIDF